METCTAGCRKRVADYLAGVKARLNFARPGDTQFAKMMRAYAVYVLGKAADEIAAMEPDPSEGVANLEEHDEKTNDPADPVAG